MLFPIDEVLDDVFDTDIGASDETKEANEEESCIFCSSKSETEDLMTKLFLYPPIFFFMAQLLISIRKGGNGSNSYLVHL